MQRPQCSVFIATSLDGFIARLDGGIDFLDRVQVEGEDYGFAEFFGSIDAIVFGRNTYEVARGFGTWPYAGKRCVVLTHRPLEPAHGEERHSGELAPLLERLHRDGVRRVYIDGGQVVQQALVEGVVDDLTISVVPVLLGSGLPLFASLPRELPLRTVSARTFASGLIQLRYAVNERLAPLASPA